HIAAALTSKLRVVASGRDERPLRRTSASSAGPTSPTRPTCLTRPTLPGRRRAAAKIPCDPTQSDPFVHSAPPHLLPGIGGDRDDELRIGRRILTQVEGEDGAVRRIRRRPVAGHRAEARGAGGLLAERVEEIRVAKGEEVRVFTERLRAHLAK